MIYSNYSMYPIDKFPSQLPTSLKSCPSAMETIYEAEELNMKEHLVVEEINNETAKYINGLDFTSALMRIALVYERLLYLKYDMKLILGIEYNLCTQLYWNTICIALKLDGKDRYISPKFEESHGFVSISEFRNFKAEYPNMKSDLDAIEPAMYQSIVKCMMNKNYEMIYSKLIPYPNKKFEFIQMCVRSIMYRIRYIDQNPPEHAVHVIIRLLALYTPHPIMFIFLIIRMSKQLCKIKMKPEEASFPVLQLMYKVDEKTKEYGEVACMIYNECIYDDDGLVIIDDQVAPGKISIIDVDGDEKYLLPSVRFFPKELKQYKKIRTLPFAISDIEQFNVSCTFNTILHKIIDELVEGGQGKEKCLSIYALLATVSHY